jgi:hypothetical protein
MIMIKNAIRAKEEREAREVRYRSSDQLSRLDSRAEPRIFSSLFFLTRRATAKGSSSSSSSSLCVCDDDGLNVFRSDHGHTKCREEEKKRSHHDDWLARRFFDDGV